MSEPRILIFDIEATALNASFGHTLCVGYQYLDEEKATVAALGDFPRVKSPRDEPDKYLLREMRDLFTNKADIIVSFYGKEYDRKFLNTRMLMNGLPILPPLNSEHIDLYFTARGNLKLHSGRLQGLSESLGCPWSKTPVRADVWRWAQRGDRDAIAYVIEHCKLDVEILRWCYLKLRGFIRQHPWVGTPHESCRNCGGSLVKRGFNITTGHGKRQRYQCSGCGAWSLEPAPKKLRRAA